MLKKKKKNKSEIDREPLISETEIVEEKESSFEYLTHYFLYYFTILFLTFSRKHHFLSTKL